MKTDIQIAQETTPLNITEIAEAAGIDEKYAALAGRLRELGLLVPAREELPVPAPAEEQPVDLAGIGAHALAQERFQGGKAHLRREIDLQVGIFKVGEIAPGDGKGPAGERAFKNPMRPSLGAVKWLRGSGHGGPAIG